MLEVNKVYNGDCFELIKLLEDKSIDVSFTSPPYNRKVNDKYKFYDDTVTDFYGFLDRIIIEMLRVTKGTVILNIQKTYFNKKDVFKIIGKYSDIIQEIVVWCKTNPQPSQQNSITNAHEYFIMFNDNPIKSNNFNTYNYIMSSVNSESHKDHGAIMKKEICEFFIENFTNENDIVLDPFSGLFTTQVVCKEKGRRYLGFELSEEYFKIGQDRLNGISFDGQTSIFTDFELL